jgi:glycosyltransferase involved in cell wall biosynthesis
MTASPERIKAPRRLLLMGDARQVHLRKWASFFKDDGFEVLSMSLEPVRSFPGDLEIPRVPPSLPDCIRYPLAVPFAKRLIDRFKPDLINAHFLPNYGMIAAMTGWKPWILTAWGSDIMILPAKSPFHMWRTRFVLKRCASVVSDAFVMTDRLLELGCRPDAVLTVPYGVDTDVFKPEEGDRPAAPGPMILSNRKLEEVYNVETIVRAFARIKRELPRAVLTIAGDGSRKTALERMVESLGLGNVDFVSAVEHDRMPSLLRKHHIYVSASLSDTTSVSLLEAMACGVFPVVSDIPANREWIRDGENGLLFPPRDDGALAESVVQAFHDHDLRTGATAANLKLIREKADWYRNMEAVARLFERVVSTR